MERGPVPGVERSLKTRRRRKARVSGLKIGERDGFWHITGTVRSKGGSRRVRESTGLPARADTKEDAENFRNTREREIIDELHHGIKPSVPTVFATDQYISRPRQREIGSREEAIAKAIGERFGQRKLNRINDNEWLAFLTEKTVGRSPQNRERIITAINAILNWCRKRPREWLAALPQFERNEDARKPKHRRARRIGELTPDLIRLMIDHAAPHFGAQMAVEWSTGARVSSILFGCRICDVILAPGRSRIMFHDTKNGEPVVAALSSWAADKVTEYLKWRGDLQDREAPLFVTNRRDREGKRLPYTDTRGLWGGQNKRAWLGMRARTIKTLLKRAGEAPTPEEADALRSQAALVGEVTQHWFRHLLATTLLARTGNIRMVMEQGGWLDMTSVMGYAHDIPEARHREIEGMFADTTLTPDPSKKSDAAS